MKITKRQLRQIVREEYKRFIEACNHSDSISETEKNNSTDEKDVDEKYDPDQISKKAEQEGKKQDRQFKSFMKKIIKEVLDLDIGK
jgi:hypothetical protein